MKIPLIVISLAAMFTIALWFLAPERKLAPPPSSVAPIDLQPPVSAGAPSAFRIPASEKENSACYRTYAAFFASDSIRVHIAFGYKDARPARYVGDRYERNMLATYLTHPCPPGFYACGFSRPEDDADQFTREIIAPDGRRRQVVVTLTHSSAGPDDNLNREDSHQAWLSRYSKTNMEEGLKGGEAVLYNGHSRDGGGPDFEPPRLRADDDHVDYYWYTQNRPGISWLMNHLDNAIPYPKLLGLFSCVSTNLFAKDVRRAKPKMGLVTNRQLLYYTDAMKSLLGTLSSILGFSCETGFDSAISAESTGGSTLLQGFFRED